MPLGKRTCEFASRIIPARKTQTLAQRLAELDKFQFQHWALSLIDARALKEGDGKGADRGVDGLQYFYESKVERRKIIVHEWVSVFELKRRRGASEKRADQMKGDVFPDVRGGGPSRKGGPMLTKFVQ